MSSLEKGLIRQAPPPQRTETDDVPRTFLGFCRWVGAVLTPGQTELARVAFDGMEPVDRSIATRLFGEGDLQMGIRRVVAAVCGARAGKTYVLVALRLVWGMLVRDLPPLPPGTEAGALILAPRDAMRMEAYRYARGVVENTPALRAMLVGEPGADSLTLRRPHDGKSVELICGVATAGGTAARAKWWTDVALDECAFFRDDTAKVNDKEIYRAASARLLPGGQMILASTPWAEAGLLYDRWKKRPDDTLVVHAPTLVLHDTPITRDIVAAAYAEDPDNAKREFDAQFMTTGTTVFFESATIDSALTDEPFTLQPGDLVSGGVDLAFIGDSSALLLSALRGDTIHVFEGHEERPQDGQPLDPTRTISSFVAAMKGRVTYATADQHYWAALQTECNEHDLALSKAPSPPSEAYVRARMKMRGKKVRIHPLSGDVRDRLVQQLREVQGKPTAGGAMSIVHPRWSKGGHGDLCAAFVLTVWPLYGEAVAAPPPKPEEAARIARAEFYERERTRKYWEAPGGAADRGARAFWNRRG